MKHQSSFKRGASPSRGRVLPLSSYSSVIGIIALLIVDPFPPSGSSGSRQTGSSAAAISSRLG